MVTGDRVMISRPASINPDDPSTTDQDPSLEDIIDLSLSMLEMAKAQDLPGLEEMEARRRPMISACFSRPVVAGNQEEVESIGAGIREIMSIDQAIIELSEKFRNETEKELCDISKGRRVVNAYGANAG